MRKYNQHAANYKMRQIVLLSKRINMYLIMRLSKNKLNNYKTMQNNSNNNSQ